MFGGQLEFFAAKWTELPVESDAVNLDFVRKVVGKARVVSGAVVSRTPYSFPLVHGFGRRSTGKHKFAGSADWESYPCRERELA
jgi:hypothetical protein